MPDVTVRPGPDSEPDPGRGHARPEGREHPSRADAAEHPPRADTAEHPPRADTAEHPPRADTAEHPPPYDGTLLTALVERLRHAGLDPDAEQLCDALWLAHWTGRGREPDRRDARGGDGPPPVGEPHAPGTGPESGTGSEGGPGTGTGAAPPDGPAAPPDADDAERPVTLYPMPRPGRHRERSAGALAGRPLGVPVAPALPAPLELQRALRPLQRYRPAVPPARRTLDEVATVELSARAGGLIIPVFRGVSRADALLQLVLDASSSMRVWERLFTELQEIFSRLGAFRDVQVRYLHQGPEGAPAVSRSPDPAAAPLSSADRLSDPTGRRVTVVVSDCAGPLWHSGRAHRLLHQLGRQAPIAVLQPLPQRMWNRTRLPVTYGLLSRGEGPGGAAVLKVDAATAPAVRPGSLAIPVLPPVAGALGAWARLLSGTGAGRISGAVGWVRADQPPAPVPRPGSPLSSLQLVSRFRSAASPVAGQLAVYLAAAPLYLPVMQLVQRTMLPDSGPSELAEVLLSGLLSRAKGNSPDDEPWYEFAPGVQEALLGPLGRDEAVLVLKHCSEYIEQRFGRGGPNFPALVLAQLEDARRVPIHPGTGEETDGLDELYGSAFDGDRDGDREQRVPHPFAEVARRVLDQFVPSAPPGESEPVVNVAVESARDLLRQFDSDGMVQYLIDAVQLLRSATEHEEPGGFDPALWAEFARCLLRLWEVQGSGELLSEAERAAERAVSHPRAVRERAVLAKVLHAAADDRRRRGDRRGALELLRRADREYTVAGAALGLDPAEVLRLTLDRVRALETQWLLGGDTALLQSAIGMLEAFADVWPDQENRPSGLPLAHGRTLLRLSGATSDTEQAQLYAEQAARSLRKALAPGDQTIGSQARVQLDLVDALLRSGEGLEEAGRLIEQSLATVRDDRLIASLRTRAARLRVARYGRADGAGETADAGDLEEAAEYFALAARGTARDSRAHADLLAEWGSALLTRAALPDGGPFTGAAVRVLRDCRTETVSGTARQAERLLMLGQALMLRHRINDDRVDLREAEHLFGLAAQEARDPLTAARCWLELGRSHVEAHRTLRRPARLDDAAEAFRDAADAARTAEAELDNPRQLLEAVHLRAEAHRQRGMTYEEAGRPRAAREAYRAAHAEWRRLPDGGGEAARLTTARLAELER
ncbi:SAV_2336 N-terminal domain-related protein [Streptomyces corynorhini]|uniref:SAV_2336 N-terminal domain-related protein n=1 Tax=Streptomyces corynorhini TaxID=2282652 RepID=UPI0018F3ACD2|nr:SAV_2336 N-terminal domain-related protein [Streptomyces corynorhini]